MLLDFRTDLLNERNRDLAGERVLIVLIWLWFALPLQENGLSL